MRTIVLATTAALPLLTGIPADAADLSARAPLYKAPPPVAYSWTGFYVGAHVGAGWSNNDWKSVDSLGIAPFRLGSGSGSGFLGGAQVGVNYQVDTVVAGLEADVSWAAVSGDACELFGGTINCNSRADRFGTVTGRLGVAADRALLYFKGGAAWIHDTHILTLLTAPEATVSAIRWGWTAGAGIEYALTRNWSAKLEYDFMDFGTKRAVFDPLGGGLVTFTTDIKERFQTVKFGLNYKFDWGAPVVANY
jgi:outer membrane immunogenic protein